MAENRLTQVREYIAENFSQVEKDLFDKIFSAFPEHIVSPTTQSVFSEDSGVTSINGYTGEVDITANEITFNEDSTVEKLLFNHLVFDYDDDVTFDDIHPTNSNIAEEVNTVNGYNGVVELDSTMIPFINPIADFLIEIDPEVFASKTLKSFMDEYFTFDLEDHVAEAYQKGSDDTNGTVISINNNVGDIFTTSRSTYFDKLDKSLNSLRYTLRNIFTFDISPILPDPVGEENFLIVENQDVLTLLAVLAKTVGSAREMVLNLSNSKNIASILSNLSKQPKYLERNNLMLLYLNSISSPLQIVQNIGSPISQAEQLLSYKHVMQASHLISKYSGSLAGIHLLTRAYLLDLELPVDSYNISSNYASLTTSIEFTDLSMTEAQLTHYKFLLNQIRPAGIKYIASIVS